MKKELKSDSPLRAATGSRSYFPGMDCICAARSEGECGCPGVDWTSSEVHDLRAMLKEARESLAFRRDLYRCQRKLMLEIMAERDELRAAISSENV